MKKLYTKEDLKNAFEAARKLTHSPKYFGGYNPKGTSDDHWDETYPEFKDYFDEIVQPERLSEGDTIINKLRKEGYYK